MNRTCYNALAVLLLIKATCVSATSAFEEIDLSFESDSFELYGTLTLPDTNIRPPVVVYAHGSGPADRDQSVPITGSNAQCLYPGLYGNVLTPFKDLASQLAHKGIASFRYDKRTLTHGSVLDPVQVRPDDFINDLINAAGFIRNNGMVNPESVFLLGYSQGGNFLPVAASELEFVRGVIPMAVPAFSIDSITADQIRHIEASCGDSVKGEEDASDFLEIMDEIRRGELTEEINIMGGYTSFWKDWMSLTDTALEAYESLALPSLFLQGVDDINVTMANLHAYYTTLGNEQHAFYIAGGLNHYFTPADFPKVPPAIGDTTAKWIHRHSAEDPNYTKPNEKNSYEIRLKTLANNRFEVKSNEPLHSTSIYSLTGQQMRTIHAKDPDRISFSLNDVDNGIYIIIVKSPDHKVVYRDKVLINQQ